MLMRTDVVKKVKAIITEYYLDADCGIFDCRGLGGDEMENLYDDGTVSVEICYQWAYFEILGLSELEFAEVKKHYTQLLLYGEDDDE